MHQKEKSLFLFYLSHQDKKMIAGKGSDTLKRGSATDRGKTHEVNKDQKSPVTRTARHKVFCVLQKTASVLTTTEIYQVFAIICLMLRLLLIPTQGFSQISSMTLMNP